jgi:hypothetical protein
MSIQDDLSTFAKGILDSANSCLPARVVQVNSDGSVNVVAIRNDEIKDCIITVPVLRPETQRAYIMLKIKAGDRGIVKFCDKSIESYRLTGNENYNGDDRQHSLSDGVFQLGFLPDNEKFVFPDGELVIGLKNNTFILNVSESGNLTITASAITINSDVTVNGTLTATEDVVGGGISLKSHVHSGVTSGSSNTGSPQ